MSNEEVFLHARFGRTEPSGKSSLLYDLCKLNEIHVLKMTSYDERMENHENHVLHATHQIAESWIHASRKVLERIANAVLSRTFEKVAEDYYVVEMIWKLLAEAEESALGPRDIGGGGGSKGSTKDSRGDNEALRFKERVREDSLVAGNAS
ncbi:hypothetical protein JHK86_017323 [Glycine max]|nr:hypothetical protein JHK86_017323 [Glycine max]